MHDEGDNVITPYINIGTAVLIVIGVTTTAGVTWYCRSKNAKKAQLQKYIEEYEAEQLAAKTNEEATTENNPLLNNNHAAVDMTGVSYEEEGTSV